MDRVLRIGTRDSELALWQARKVQSLLEALGYITKLVPVKSQGDLTLDIPLYAMGITGVFTKVLDIAMLQDKIDIAVHSMKDVPTLLPQGIVKGAVLKRANVQDVLVYKENHPYQGSEYILNDNGIIAQKNDYKLGFLDQQILYYRTGNPKSKTDYGLYGSIDKITYYEKKDKKEKEVLTFYEGFPYNGYEYNDLEKNNSFIYYEKGSIIEAKQYDDKNILRYHRKKHEDGHIVADIYNEKGKKDINYVITQESKPSSYEGMVHLDFIQYENGKEVRTGRITNGILEKGSIELQLNEKSKNIYRREENWITVEQYYSGELLKIYKINVKHPQFSSIYEGDMDEFFIYERKLSPFVIVGDSMNED